MAEKKLTEKASYRVSLLVIIILLLGFLFLGFFLQGYFNFKLIKEQSHQTPSDVTAAFWRFVISDVLFVFLVGGCFFILFKIFIRPLKKLTGLCNEMRRGNLTTEQIQSDIKEIDQLTSAFNDAICDLKKYKETIEKSNEILEAKVKERTKDLEKLTATLEEKVKERTKQLEEKIEEMEKFEKVAVGRELKMMEQKKEMDKLVQELEKVKQTNNAPN